jgi:gamma-glutamylcyclotransferase (GGCT)/AIG2-like uncharacterized protein YtfP
MKVAVYGTLRDGEHNNRLMRGARFVERATITGSLYDVAYGGYPGLILDNGGPVVVEVYEIDEDILQGLDYLEGYDEHATEDHNHYNRRTVEINGEKVYVYEYNGDVDSRTPIHDGDWVRYKADRRAATRTR